MEHWAHMVERAKQSWLGWLLSGIPVALAICALIFTSGSKLASIDARLTRLEQMDTRISSLELQVQSLQLQVQKLEDELVFEKKIIEYPPRPKRRVEYRQQPEDNDAARPWMPPTQ
jgi:hypothetical protein